VKLGGLKPEPGSTKRRKRIGRGPGSGHGKTSGRGHGGAGQHSAPRHDARFEGGQMPFYRRIPKRGFVNPTRKEYAAVNLTDLAELDGGEVAQALSVTAHAFSRSAREKIEKAGGKAEVVS